MSGRATAAAHVRGREGSDQGSQRHGGAADQRELAMQEGAPSVGPGPEQGGDQHLGHGDSRHLLDVEAADGEERRHVVEEGDHDGGAAHAHQSRDERADEAERDEGERKGGRHRRTRYRRLE